MIDVLTLIQIWKPAQRCPPPQIASPRLLAVLFLEELWRWWFRAHADLQAEANERPPGASFHHHQPTVFSFQDMADVPHGCVTLLGRRHKHGSVEMNPHWAVPSISYGSPSVYSSLPPLMHLSSCFLEFSLTRDGVNTHFRTLFTFMYQKTSLVGFPSFSCQLHW